MAFAYVQSNSNYVAATGTQITCALTGIGAGNLIALHVRHDITGATTVSSVSDGSDSPDGNGDYINNAGLLGGQMFYYLSHGGGDKTFTVTLAATREYRVLHVLEFSYSNTCAIDVYNEGVTSGDQNSVSSGNVTTTGNTALAVGGWAVNDTTSSIDQEINNVDEDGGIAPASNFTETFWRILSSTFTDGATTVTWTSACDAYATIIVFKETAGGVPIAAIAHHHRMLQGVG